jgi:hypothetical protein
MDQRNLSPGKGSVKKKSSTSRVIHMSKAQTKASKATVHGPSSVRMASGSDIAPSEDDPRFHEI